MTDATTNARQKQNKYMTVTLSYLVVVPLKLENTSFGIMKEPHQRHTSEFNASDLAYHSCASMFLND